MIVPTKIRFCVISLLRIVGKKKIGFVGYALDMLIMKSVGLSCLLFVFRIYSKVFQI